MAVSRRMTKTLEYKIAYVNQKLRWVELLILIISVLTGFFVVVFRPSDGIRIYLSLMAIAAALAYYVQIQMGLTYEKNGLALYFTTGIASALFSGALDLGIGSTIISSSFGPVSFIAPYAIGGLYIVFVPLVFLGFIGNDGLYYLRQRFHVKNRPSLIEKTINFSKGIGKYLSKPKNFVVIIIVPLLVGVASSMVYAWYTNLGISPSLTVTYYQFSDTLPNGTMSPNHFIYAEVENNGNGMANFSFLIHFSRDVYFNSSSKIVMGGTAFVNYNNNPYYLEVSMSGIRKGQFGYIQVWNFWDYNKTYNGLTPLAAIANITSDAPYQMFSQIQLNNNVTKSNGTILSPNSRG